MDIFDSAVPEFPQNNGSKEASLPSVFSTGLMTSNSTLSHQEPTSAFFPSTGHALFSQSAKASFLTGILVKLRNLNTTPPHVCPSLPFQKAPTMSFSDTMHNYRWATPSSLVLISLMFHQTSPIKLQGLQLSMH